VNKIIIRTLVCLSVLFVSALQANTREGIYAGAGVGSTFNHYDLVATNLLTGLTFSTPNSPSKTLGNVFLGYGSMLFNDNLYLAAELGSYFPRRTVIVQDRPGVTITNLLFTDELHVQDYLTIDLLPGHKINENVLIYVRAGLAISQLSIDQFPAIGVPAFNDKETKVGGRIGTGINIAVTNHFALGFDYFYTLYKKKSSEFQQFNILFSQELHTNYVGVSFFLFTGPLFHKDPDDEDL